jgi:glyoxylase-like metal-dependent hydrolase (beta-lactamase superfamily II)
MKLMTACAATVAVGLAFPATAQQQQRPTFATTKVEGTDGVYIFRYQNHQAMFVVTPAGVIATDPISYGRPQAAVTYVDEIKKVSNNKPIKYLIYSHHHYDHAAGGKPFKDAGAKIVAHKNATARLKVLKDAATPVPDESVGDKKVIKLGGTTLELHYTGRNHSDSSLVMFLPKEKIIFAVDFNSLGAVPSRLAVNDSYPTEWEASLRKTLALGWEKMIPGHPGPNDRLGTRADMEQQLALMTDLSAEVKKASDEGKCFDPAVKDVRLPKYGTLTGYEQNIEWVIHRYCGYWGRGI